MHHDPIDRPGADGTFVCLGGTTLSVRSAVLLVLSTLALSAAGASAAPRATSGISPSLIHQGDHTTITVRVTNPKARCSASLRFSNGKTERLSPKRPTKGRVTFLAAIAANAAVGQGKWSVICNSRVVSTGSFVVVQTKSTSSTAAPRVVVSKQGFNQRPDRSPSIGSQLSFGLILSNTSQTEDAQDVYVIVNMVTASGQLIGSIARTIPVVPAGGTYNYGDSLHLRTQVSATSLEVAIRVGSHEPKQVRLSPDFANVRILPGQFDLGYVAEVDGEVVNDNTSMTLRSAKLSLVVLDANGLPIGGGTALSMTALPPNTRFVFTAQQGFTPIPLAQAASVLISATTTYGPSL